MIRDVRREDAKGIVDIYNYYILNTAITFECEELKTEDMENRIIEKTRNNPWIVYEEDGIILGYAYVGDFAKREAFKYSKEVSIYLNKDSCKKGIGTNLMKELIKRCNDDGVHTLISIITYPNDSSISLHKKFGFEKAGFIKEAGYKMDKWHDVIYLQKML
ncbi:MAG: GNAT family N-acetyltransferase [Clostridiaceae bacterium]|nr:GNAT family N-acetyltransferase [Clostridiaceae bacterium]